MSVTVYYSVLGQSANKVFLLCLAFSVSCSFYLFIFCQPF